MAEAQSSPYCDQPLTAIIVATLLSIHAGGNPEPLIIVGVVAAYVATLAIKRRWPEPTPAPAPESAPAPVNGGDQPAVHTPAPAKSGQV